MNDNPNQTNEARVRAIADKFKSVANQLRGDLDHQFAALDEAQKASGKTRQTRIVLLGEIAQASVQGDWSISDIDAAAEQAKAMLIGNNNPDDKRSINALRVLASELKTPAHPLVRVKFQTILCAVTDAWENEEQLKKLADKGETPDLPVHKWRARLYQAVIGAAVAVKEGRAVIAEADDVTDYAISQDPDFDPKRVASQVKAMAKTLAKIMRVFPVAGFDAAVTALQASDERTLRLAQARAGTARASVAPPPVVPEKPILRVVQPVASIQPLPQGPQPAPAAGGASEAGIEATQPEVGETLGVDSGESLIEGAYDPMSGVDDILNNAA